MANSVGVGDGKAFPESATFTDGFLGSLDKMFSAANLRPTDVGLNVILMTQELPFTNDEQLFISVKSSPFVPVIAILFTNRSDLPLFFIVIILGTDIYPTFEAKFTAFRATDILGGGARPESFTLTIGFFGSFEKIFMVALFLPKGVTGVNVTVI